MNPPTSIRLSQQAKDQLTRLKSVTGIEQWNILCRFGFLLSLAENAAPTTASLPFDSNVEMTWKVFCGDHEYTIWAILVSAGRKHGVNTDPGISHLLRSHIHRGIAHLLATQMKNLARISAVMLATERRSESPLVQQRLV